MNDIQVSFEDLMSKDKNIEKKKSNKISTKKQIVSKKITNPKKTSVKKVSAKKVKQNIKSRNPRVTMTQEDMDKLCEVYDWYLNVKDIDILSTCSVVSSKKLEINENIIKNKKNISATVDEEVWNDFNRLCDNTHYRKGEILTLAIKEFLLKHKDII